MSHPPAVSLQRARFARGHAFLLALSLCACASSGAKDPKDGPEETDPHLIASIVEANKKTDPIGKLLVDLDGAIRAWNNLFLSAQSQAERNKARTLETAIMTQAHERRAELVTELESGPLNNRIVAAAALGFTKDEEAQSPLLAALEDSQEEVVGSALLGLWLLGRNDTPLERICAHLGRSKNEMVRSNAALCLAALVQTGARADCVLPTVRMALLDQAPSVRSHSAIILATLLDRESLPALEECLHDEQPLVSAAASRAVSHIGTQVPEERGTAARALVGAWVGASEPQKSQIFRALVALAGVNYGTDEEEWRRWAARLP